LDWIGLDWIGLDWIAQALAACNSLRIHGDVVNLRGNDRNR